jgi:serine/threonine protein kinase
MDHPHIVKLYEIYEDESSLYLITEYLSGGELLDAILMNRNFSESTAA